MSQALSYTHPDYSLHSKEWELMRDAMGGEEHVKALGFKYLKPTAGMVLDGAAAVNRTYENLGWTAYCAYRDRAVFPDHVEIGVETLVGILNSKPTVVKVPKKMEPLLERFTAEGDNFAAAVRKLHAEQLVTGRAGLLIDMPATLSEEHPFPYVALYKAEDIVNWDEGLTDDKVDKLNLVVLKEDIHVRDGYNWTPREQYRSLILQSIDPGEDVGTDNQAYYKYAVSIGHPQADETQFKTPRYSGNPLNKIPFVFVNTKDLASKPDKPPLLGLARMCFTIYRAEADYRTTLYMQGQETLVVIGGILNANSSDSQGEGSDSVRTGAGARIDVNIGGDAKYIGVSADGLEEQRHSLENDHKAASVRTGQLMAPGKASLESGESLKTRLAAQTATLSSIAITAASALERALKMIAEWIGESPAEVRVEPNMQFIQTGIDGQDLVQLITAKNLGYPVSSETLHALALERGITTKSFDEEMSAISSDPEVLKKLAELAGGSLTGNNPVQSAGGPKAGTEGDKTGAGNQPKQ